MRLEHDLVLSAFRTLREISDGELLMAHEKKQIPVSVDDTLALIAKAKGFDISISEVPFAGTHTRGLIEINDTENAAVIYVRENQTPFEKRFTTIKEAAQLLVRTGPCDSSVRGTETIDALVEDGYERQMGSHTAPERPTQCDILAEFVAIEIMYPYDKRLFDEPNVTGHDYSDLAIELQLPEYIIGTAFANMGTSSELWARLDQEQKIK